MCRWRLTRDASSRSARRRQRSYLQVFPAAQEATHRWRAELIDRHGAALSLDHYVVRIGPRRDGPTRWRVEDDLEQKFGDGLRLSFSEDRQLALGRVFENFVPPGRLE